MDQPGKVAIPSRGQLSREMNILLSAFGSPVLRQPAHLHTQAESVLTYGVPPEFRGGVHLFTENHHTPSGQSRVYRVTQLRTDGVHCREPAGTGPVNLKVVPNECCFGRSVTMNHLICASLSHTHYWYGVGIMLKVPTSYLVSIYSNVAFLLCGPGWYVQRT